MHNFRTQTIISCKVFPWSSDLPRAWTHTTALFDQGCILDSLHAGPVQSSATLLLASDILREPHSTFRSGHEIAGPGLSKKFRKPRSAASSFGTVDLVLCRSQPSCRLGPTETHCTLSAPWGKNLGAVQVLWSPVVLSKYQLQGIAACLVHNSCRSHTWHKVMPVYSSVFGIRYLESSAHL